MYFKANIAIESLCTTISLLKNKRPRRLNYNLNTTHFLYWRWGGVSFPSQCYLYKSNIGPGVYRFLHVIQREHIAVVKYEGNWTWSSCWHKLRPSCDFIIEIMCGALSHTVYECAYNLTYIPSAVLTALS